MNKIRLVVTFAVVLLMAAGTGYLYAHGGHAGGHGGSHEREGGRGHEHGESGHGHEHDKGNHGHHGNHDNNRNVTKNVNVYGGGWGWGWGPEWGWGGPSIEVNSQPSTVVVEQQQTQPPVPQQTVAGAPAYGTRVKTLPPGAQSKDVNGVTAYESNSVWYRPYFAPDGVDYMVVAPPPEQNDTQ